MTCNGDARFDTYDQAAYVAEQLVDDVGGEWEVQECGEHWHVVEASL